MAKACPNRRVWFIGIAMFAAGELAAQYNSVYVTSITNSASYAVSGVNGFGIAQGSLFVVFGNNLGPNTPVSASGFPLPYSLGGTSIQVAVGTVKSNAIMIYSSQGQAAAILPSNVPVGDGVVVLTFNGASSAPTPIKVMKSAFGIYSTTSNGVGAGVITDTNYALKTTTEAGQPGEILTIWGTGLGAVAGGEDDGPLPGNKFPRTEVFVGGQSATVRYAGRSGCCAGVDEIIFEVPTNTPEGCFVPLSVQSGGIVSNFVTLPIANKGGACADAVGPPASLVRRAQAGQSINVGIVALGPTSILEAAGFSFLGDLASQFSSLLETTVTENDIRRIIRAHGEQRLQVIAKFAQAHHLSAETMLSKLGEIAPLVQSLDNMGAAAGFAQLNGLGHVVSQFGSVLPPPGTCSVAHEWGFVSQAWGTSSRSRDAGTQLVLKGPIGTRVMSNVSNGEYQVPLGSGFVTLQLPFGTYIVTGSGGQDIGAFTASLIGGSNLRWTNKDEIGVVDRTHSLTVTWTGSNLAGYVLFGGAASGAGTGAAFACVESAQKGTFTVPAYVLSAMPMASSDKGYLFLVAHPLQNPFSATGIDAGYFVDFSSDSKTAAFQ